MKEVMSTLTEAQLAKLKSIYLGKYPTMYAWGATVTDEQAKDIILRTDRFLTRAEENAGGNNRAWNKAARHALGFEPEIIRGTDSFFWMDLEIAVREKVGFIETEYVRNTWASCSSLSGPNGWCQPNGTIWQTLVLGKYPEAEEIYAEWVKLAQAFTYLDLTVTLEPESSTGWEGGQIEYPPVVSFRVQKGSVEILPDPLTLPSNSSSLYKATLVEPNSVLPHRSSEQGLRDEWILEYGTKLKPVIAEAFAELTAARAAIANKKDI